MIIRDTSDCEIDIENIDTESLGKSCRKGQQKNTKKNFLVSLEEGSCHINASPSFRSHNMDV